MEDLNDTEPQEPSPPSGSTQYLRIAEAISNRIGKGIYKPGEKLPSGEELRNEFGVSLSTLRQALGLLSDQGLIQAEQGRGTFVRAVDLGDASFRLEQLTDQWRREGLEVQLLEAATKKADERVAEKLRIPVGTRTVFLRSLVSQEERPLMYQIEHVVFDARRPLVESQLHITSLSGLLDSRSKGGLIRGSITARAVNLDAEAAALLEQPMGKAGFCLEHLIEDFTGQPVSWGSLLCRTDEFYLTTRLGPGRPGG